MRVARSAHSKKRADAARECRLHQRRNIRNQGVLQRARGDEIARRARVAQGILEDLARANRSSLDRARANRLDNRARALDIRNRCRARANAGSCEFAGRGRWSACRELRSCTCPRQRDGHDSPTVVTSPCGRLCVCGMCADCAWEVAGLVTLCQVCACAAGVPAVVIDPNQVERALCSCTKCVPRTGQAARND